MNVLVIVESPAKAKKIKGFYKDKSIVVKSSFGHIYDLDKSDLSVDIHNNFKPKYTLLPDKQKVVRELKSCKCSNVLLAADDDREGEAIAWHCGRLLRVSFNDRNRIKFNEITKKALDNAILNPVQVDMNEVNAQQARRIIDRLVGYKISPLLWKHIQTDKKGLSAGRVQSCLLHMLHIHEKSIINFTPEKSYKLKGTLDKSLNLNVQFVFNKSHISTSDINTLLNTFVTNSNIFSIKESNQTTEKVYSSPPLITSTLQQQAQKDYGFKVSYTMSMAQKLYDNGYITYMRTDSTYINTDFEKVLQKHITTTFGEKYYLQKKTKKVKGAQEAHEAIRPTKIDTILPDTYNENENKLYSLIRKRTIQSYMAPAIYDVQTILFTNKYSNPFGYFKSKQKQIIFPGFLRYSECIPNSIIQDNITKQTDFELIEAVADNIPSKPPSYYNESAIVKHLESNGIGRPSTYSNIINTIYSRNYTEITTIPEKEEIIDSIHYNNGLVSTINKSIKIPQQKNKIILTDLGKQVLQYLEAHFSNIINCEFTALVEADLDNISIGQLDWVTVVKKVYSMFSCTVEDQMKLLTIKNNVVHTVKYNNQVIDIINGRYGYYFRYQKKNYNISNYLKWKGTNVEELMLDDIHTILTYPFKLGSYKNHSIVIHIGPYGYYMKYNKKNYKINQTPPYNKEYCIRLLQ